MDTLPGPFQYLWLCRRLVPSTEFYSLLQGALVMITAGVHDDLKRFSSLLVRRLFYAGAMERQMPEILTMIQVSRMTPTPAVLCIAMLSLFYLSSDNIDSLITYVGFATWVS
jgi:amino acid transporter